MEGCRALGKPTEKRSGDRCSARDVSSDKYEASMSAMSSETVTGASASGDPRIDLVILNYNYGRFLADAISSALAQTRPFARIIVVNDGSTDDSLARIAPFRSRVKVVDKANGGQLSACFAGLAECGSEYVWFLDADDYLAETAVESLTPILASRPIKVQFQLVGVDEGKVPRDSLFPVYAHGYGSAAMIEENRTIGYYNSAPTSGNVFARAFLNACDPRLLDPRDFIDGVPNLIAPHLGEVASVNLPLAFYRVHGSSHSQWGKPSVALLEREIDMLAKRWREAEALSGGRVRAPEVETVLYVLERRLMIAALTAPEDVPHATRRFLARLGETRGSAPMRIGRRLWANLLRVPNQALRERLVVARRSPNGRPRIVNKAILGAKRIYATLGRAPEPKSFGG
jgi:glycosyltransferase involved in cell wall biosynthesis